MAEHPPLAGPPPCHAQYGRRAGTYGRVRLGRRRAAPPVKPWQIKSRLRIPLEEPAGPGSCWPGRALGERGEKQEEKSEDEGPVMRLGASCPFLCVARRGFFSLCLPWPPVPLRCTLHPHCLPLYLAPEASWDRQADGQQDRPVSPSQAETTRQRARFIRFPSPF